MLITNKWLEEKGACREGVDWFNAQKETDGIKVLKKLMGEDKFDWANWTISRVFNHEQQVKYAVFAAEQVFYLWAEKHPKEAAIWRKWVDDGGPRAAARAARDAVAAGAAAEAAGDAAGAAAGAAAYAAEAAVAAGAAAWAAGAAGAAAGAAARAAGDAMKEKIIKYGIKLLEVARKCQ